MSRTEIKLTEVERINITAAIDFLVPYVHSIVKIFRSRSFHGRV